MMKRLFIAGVVLALIGAACGDDTADTTEATANTVTTAATTGTGTAPPPDTAPPETAATTMPEEPFILEGDFSAFVAALQFFLDCDGYGPISIDGMFGDGTTVAVRLAQNDLGYEETGEPTESMFAELAMACDQGRSFFFPPGETVTQSAGYVGTGSDDEIGLDATAGQMLLLATTGGDPVDLELQAPDGSSLGPAPTGGATMTLPTTGAYTVRVTSDTPAWYLLTVTLTGEGQNVDASSIILDADEMGGLGVVDHMDSADDVIQILTAKLGAPSADTGEDAETGCPGVHRQVTWAVPAPPGGSASTLTAHFHNDDGRWPEMRFTDFAYWGGNGGPGLLATPRGLTVGNTTTEAIEAYPEIEFGLNPLSGDVIAWTGEFEMLFIADFGAVDIGTDLSTLEGTIIGIRLPLNNCPDELMY